MYLETVNMISRKLPLFIKISTTYRKLSLGFPCFTWLQGGTLRTMKNCLQRAAHPTVLNPCVSKGTYHSYNPARAPRLQLLQVFVLCIHNTVYHYNEDNSKKRFTIKSIYFFIYKIKCTTHVSPWGISREIDSFAMFCVVVVSILKFLKLAEDGFHKLDDGYGIYVLLQYFM